MLHSLKHKVMEGSYDIIMELCIVVLHLYNSQNDGAEGPHID